MMMFGTGCGGGMIKRNIFQPVRIDSVAGRVMAILGISLMSTLLLLLGIVFFFVYRTEENAWRGRQAEAARSAAGTVSGFIQRVQNSMTLMSILEPDQLVEDSVEIEDLLEVNPALLEMIRLDSEGRVLAGAYTDQEILASLITIPQSQWFTVAEAGQAYLGKVQLSSNNEPYLIMSIPTQANGVVAVRVRMDVLWDVVRNIQFGESGQIMVVTRDGNVIAHTDPRYVFEGVSIYGRPELSSILGAPSGEWTGTYTNFHGDPVASASTLIPGTDWIMITELPLKEAYATTSMAVALFGGVAVVIVFLVSFFMAANVRSMIAQPMEKLRDGAERIGKGELGHRIDLEKGDEIGQLAVAFNRMAADLEKQQESLQKAVAYEYESKRARELEFLLKASETTSLSLDFDTVLHTLAAHLLELSGFESCFISEWDKQSRTIIGRIDHSRILWLDEKRDIYSLQDYPRSRQVLLTGIPFVVQGEIDSEERLWMNELGRTGVVILALHAGNRVIGLVEIAAMKKNKIFSPQAVEACRNLLVRAAPRLRETFSENDPGEFFTLEEKLLEITEGEVCSISEWDQAGDRIFNTAVIAKISWAEGEGIRFNPGQDTYWNDAVYPGQGALINDTLYRGNVVVSVKPDEYLPHQTAPDGTVPMEAESVVMFPLRKGEELLGMVELYHFNRKISVSPEQVALMRTIADKASYSIENARLLGQTRRRLEEQTALHNEKEVLLKEIHHRVKNNLQIISSLLNLQTRNVKDRQILDALRDSQNRVRSMALIHEKLYQSDNLAQVNFGEYVHSLVSFLLASYQNGHSLVDLQIDLGNLYLPLETAIPCGLIVNELVTNTLKYAFPENGKGTLWIKTSQTPGGDFVLCIRDDGIGLPADLDVAGSNTLGLQLVHGLVAQLNGALEIDKRDGVGYRISFKA
ncbi:MAG: HAMP domain-containing protein [Chloroflexi bacterium CFX2]|nr:HAMP domain-containing protein [Chloroflexi bacterium CFX2]